MYIDYNQIPNKYVNGVKVQFTNDVFVSKSVFPDGTLKYYLEKDIKDVECIIIEISMEGTQDLFNLGLLKSFLMKMYPKCDFILKIRYLIYQQDDRIFSKYETFGLKYVIDYINSLDFVEVTVLGAHSDVVDMFDCYAQNNSFEEFYSAVLLDLHKLDPIWIIPDDGAYKKQIKIIEKLQNKLNRRIQYVVVNKTRDLETNQVNIELKTKFDLSNRNVVIFDDLCLGGATFKAIEKELNKHNITSCNLAVFHGIFNYGLEELANLFGRIYTTNSICKIEHPQLKIINCEQLEKYS